MAQRSMLAFWSSAAAAVFLLGGTVASLEAVLSGGNGADVLLLSLSLAGLLLSLLAAGRIAVVLGRSTGPGRRPTSHR